MKLSKKWLSDFVDINSGEKEFADAMTMSGSKVEGWEKEGSGLAGIVVGHIESVERIENSQRLSLCIADVGTAEPLGIVTGAANVKAGDYVPVALDGSTIYSGKRITAGMIRGVFSGGMLCSLAELGLSINDFPYACEDGIFILGEDCVCQPGLDIHEAIGLNDTVFEFEITSNRPDCLSVAGLAREAAATFRIPMKEPLPRFDSNDENVDDYIKIIVSDKEKCARYVGAVVKNVSIEPSPRWMRERLRASGVRPINNIVDITNYVMLEYGQPMHAFDIRTIEGGMIDVRTARQGEKITLLDGSEKTLDTDILVIADAVKPIAVAGIMGGEFSSIAPDTSVVVFESACFNAASVRNTSKKIGVRTESSSRFEKGLSACGCLAAEYRALELINILCAGEVVGQVADIGRFCDGEATVPFDPDWTNRFIGINLDAGEQAEILRRIGFTVEGGQVKVPHYRGDIEGLEDIAEEVARFYGFEKIPNRPLAGIADGRLTPLQHFEKLICGTLLACGLNEVQTYSFISPKAYDKIALATDSPLRDSVVIINPLGEDTSVMRTTALPSMLDVVARNLNFKNDEASFFELATVYYPLGFDRLPQEKQRLVLGMYGPQNDFYALKGVVEAVMKAAGIRQYEISPADDNPSYHPGRCAKLTLSGKLLACFGEVHPAVLTRCSIEQRVCCADIDFDALFANRNLNKAYQPLPKYPAAERDLALICDKNTPSAVLADAIQAAAGPLLESIRLFDVYEGAQLPQGKKSLAYHLILRCQDRTLNDEETDVIIQEIIAELGRINVLLR